MDTNAVADVVRRSTLSALAPVWSVVACALVLPASAGAEGQPQPGVRVATSQLAWGAEANGLRIAIAPLATRAPNDSTRVVAAAGTTRPAGALADRPDSAGAMAVTFY